MTAGSETRQNVRVPTSQDDQDAAFYQSGDSKMDAFFTLDNQDLFEIFGGNHLLDLIPHSPESLSQRENTEHEAKTDTSQVIEASIKNEYAASHDISSLCPAIFGPAQSAQPKSNQLQPSLDFESTKKQPALTSTIQTTSTVPSIDTKWHQEPNQQNLQPLASPQCPQPIIYHLLPNGQLLPSQDLTQPAPSCAAATPQQTSQSLVGQGNRKEATQKHGQPLVNQKCLQPLDIQTLADGTSYAPTTLQQTSHSFQRGNGQVEAGQQCGQTTVYQPQPYSQPPVSRNPIQPVMSLAQKATQQTNYPLAGQGKSQEVPQQCGQPVVYQTVTSLLQPNNQTFANPNGMQTMLIPVQKTVPPQQTSLQMAGQGKKKKVATQQQCMLQLNSQPLIDPNYTQPIMISLVPQTTQQTSQGNCQEVAQQLGQPLVNTLCLQPMVNKLPPNSQPLAEQTLVLCDPKTTAQQASHPFLLQESNWEIAGQPLVNGHQAMANQLQPNGQPFARPVTSRDPAATQQTSQPLVGQGNHQQVAIQLQQNSQPSLSSAQPVVSRAPTTKQKTRLVCQGSNMELTNLVNHRAPQAVATQIQPNGQPQDRQMCMPRVKTTTPQTLVRQENKQEMATQRRGQQLVLRSLGHPPPVTRYHPYPPLLTCPICTQRCFCPSCVFVGPVPAQQCWPPENHHGIQSITLYQPYPSTQYTFQPWVPQQPPVYFPAGDHTDNLPIQLDQLNVEQRIGPVRILNGRMAYEITLAQEQ